MAHEMASDHGLTLKEEVQHEQLEIIDCLHQEIERRSLPLRRAHKIFGSFTNMEPL